MSSVCKCDSYVLVCHLFVLVCYPYVTHMYSYVIHISLTRTSKPVVCHSHVLVYHPHVTRVYSYVICMSLICIRMSSVCRSYVLMSNPYGNCMYPYVFCMSSHPGATTDDIIDYIKPTIRQKPDIVIVYSGTNDLTKYVNTMNRVRKVVAAVKEIDTEGKIGLFWYCCER